VPQSVAIHRHQRCTDEAVFLTFFFIHLAVIKWFSTGLIRSCYDSFWVENIEITRRIDSKQRHVGVVPDWLIFVFLPFCEVFLSSIIVGDLAHELFTDKKHESGP